MHESAEKLILLVDDNQDDLMLIGRTLERIGLRTRSLPSGKEAIAYLSRDYPYRDRAAYPVPDLVLLDIKMPGTDGFAVLRWIREQQQFSDLCVVMLTCSVEILDVDRSYQLGANSFLVKPLEFGNPGHLWHSLQRFLAGRRKTRPAVSRSNADVWVGDGEGWTG